MITVQDMITHLATQLDSAIGGTTTESKVRTAVLSAWSALMTETWRYFHRSGTLQVHAFANTGTVDFSLSYLTVTLTGGTWPTNAEDMHIRLGNKWYGVYERTSDTVLTLSEDDHPPESLDDAAFHIQQVIYPLPIHVGEIVQLINPLQPFHMFQMDLLSVHSISNTSGLSSTLTGYSLVAHAKYPNRYCLWVPNLVSEDTALSYLYLQRRPEFTLVRESAGTVTVADGIATFSEAVVSDLWEGAVLRVSRNTESPTGLFGDDQNGEIIFNSNCYETLVKEILTGTTCRVDNTVMSVTAAPYVASTHIDVKGGAMVTYLQRLAEDQYGVRPVGNHTEGLSSQRQVLRANMLAHEEDGQGFRSNSQWLPWWYRMRIRDFANGVTY
jgi:hypothetical protein